MTDGGAGPEGGGKRRGTPPRGFLPAPWGVSGTLLGVAATFLCWVLVGIASAPLLAGDPLDAPIAARYGLVLLLQAVFVAVPAAAIYLTGSRPGAVGLRAPRARGLLEAALCGAVLFGLTLAYDAVASRLLPDLAARALAEQERQLQMLDGPAPLLWLVAIVVVPISEELYFRGFVFGGLRGRVDFALASGVSAAFFALIHGMPYSAPPLFAVGLGTAILFERHRSIVPCALAHGLFNALSLAWDAAA